MKVGDTLGGRFVLERRAGSGAMGVVYRARDLASGGPVAIKVLLGADLMALARFQREIEILAQLRHPGIVGYVAHGLTPEGKAYLAMEWVEGETLKDRIDRLPLTLVETLDVARAITAALVVVHRLGIIHRDLKPSNILLVGSAVRVLDFGVARGVGPALTESGDMIGTPAFMSPEQALGKREVDARSDLFSLGSVLYRCIAGVEPFASDSAVRMLLRLTTERAAPLATVAPRAPPALAALVDALLAPDPSGRPQRAEDVAAALAGMVVPTAPKTSRGLRIALIGLGFAALLVVAGLTVFLVVLAPSARVSRPTLAPGEGACPADALGCTQIDASDLSAVDPFTVIPDAVALARSYQPRAEFMGFLVDRMGSGGVNFKAGSTMLIDLCADLHADVKGDLIAVMSGSKNNDQSKASAFKPPACGPLEAYRAAVSKGAKGPMNVGYVRFKSGDQFYIVSADGGYLTIDANTCN